MRLLITGRGGKGGSWQIRGEQLGAALGATVEIDAQHVAGYDLAVLVKKPAPGLLERLHAARVPVVWDIVDAWPQPIGNEWSRAEAMSWLRERVVAMSPASIIAATRVMADDIEAAGFGIPVMALRHHARPGVELNPIRPKVQTVGYEGSWRHLGRWAGWFEHECARRGWRFVQNPERLADVDIVVAAREITGYAPTHWKSGVKLANAQGSGTPIVLAREAGYVENAMGGERWANTETEFQQAFDELTDFDARAEAAAQLIAGTPRLESVAHHYRTWLSRLTS